MKNVKFHTHLTCVKILAHLNLAMLLVPYMTHHLQDDSRVKVARSARVHSIEEDVTVPIS
jgi:hypothetical protein